MQAEALVLEQPVEPEPWEIPRLGQTAEFGSLLLRLLELQGWRIDQLPALGGGLIVTACRAGRVLERHGPTLAELAVELFQAAAGER